MPGNSTARLSPKNRKTPNGPTTNRASPSAVGRSPRSPLTTRPLNRPRAMPRQKLQPPKARHLLRRRRTLTAISESSPTTQLRPPLVEATPPSLPRVARRLKPTPHLPKHRPKKMARRSLPNPRHPNRHMTGRWRPEARALPARPSMVARAVGDTQAPSLKKARASIPPSGAKELRISQKSAAPLPERMTPRPQSHPHAARTSPNGTYTRFTAMNRAMAPLGPIPRLRKVTHPRIRCRPIPQERKNPPASRRQSFRSAKGTRPPSPPGPRKIPSSRWFVDVTVTFPSTRMRPSRPRTTGRISSPPHKTKTSKIPQYSVKPPLRPFSEGESWKNDRIIGADPHRRRTIRRTHPIRRRSEDSCIKEPCRT